MGKHNIAAGLDEKHGRLFIGCRNSETSGVIVVLDIKTGRELQSVAIGGWVDHNKLFVAIPHYGDTSTKSKGKPARQNNKR